MGALSSPPRATIRLFQLGLTIFVLTIVIGIINGVDAHEFGRHTILTHVHAGTLGWLTSSIVGAALWMFAFPDQLADRLAVATGGSVVVYVVAFWTGDEVFRPIAGTLMFLAVAWIVAAVTSRAEGATSNIPKLAMLLALYSLLVGAVLGILLGLAVTGNADWLPNGVADAHPPTMVIGYLVLAALGLAEWLLRADSEPGDEDFLRRGRWQVGLVFAAGIVLILGIVFEVEPLIIANAPLEIAGIVLFLRRLRPELKAVDWRMPSPQRWMSASVVMLVINTLYIVFLVGKSQGDFDTIRLDLVLALDHIMFVGVLTTALFGLCLYAMGGSVAGDSAVFVGVMAGLTIFVVGLIGNWTALKRIGTPILGVALLYEIAMALTRLPATSPQPSSPANGGSGGGSNG